MDDPTHSSQGSGNWPSEPVTLRDVPGSPAGGAGPEVGTAISEHPLRGIPRGRLGRRGSCRGKWPPEEGLCLDDVRPSVLDGIVHLNFLNSGQICLCPGHCPWSPLPGALLSLHPATSTPSGLDLGASEPSDQTQSGDRTERRPARSEAITSNPPSSPDSHCVPSLHDGGSSALW